MWINDCLDYKDQQVRDNALIIFLLCVHLINEKFYFMWTAVLELISTVTWRSFLLASTVPRFEDRCRGIVALALRFQAHALRSNPDDHHRLPMKRTKRALENKHCCCWTRERPELWSVHYYSPWRKDILQRWRNSFRPYVLREIAKQARWKAFHRQGCCETCEWWLQLPSQWPLFAWDLHILVPVSKCLWIWVDTAVDWNQNAIVQNQQRSRRYVV